MRSILYVSAGFLAGLFGLTLSEWLLSVPDIQAIFTFREFILFPVSSTVLAIAVVTAEIWLNNPTRNRTNRLVMWQPLSVAVMVGCLSGLLGAVVFACIAYWEWIELPRELAKVMGWVLIGFAAGIADGYSWQYRTIEGGQKRKARKRLILSGIFGILAALIAFGASELIFQNRVDAVAFKDPFGFLVLGLFLGLLLEHLGTRVNSYALRAGMGFEVVQATNGAFPRVSDAEFFNFQVPSNYLLDLDSQNGYERRIEEGMSIQLIKNKQFTIGSSSDANIFVDFLPRECATIILKDRIATIEVHGSSKVMVGAIQLMPGKFFSKDLKHNQIITLYADPSRIQSNDSDDIEVTHPFVRFIFYDRFLDPQS